MGKKLSQMTLEELWQLFPIFLTEHNPCWDGWYIEEIDLLKKILPTDTVYHHVGSTAIKGIMAKPIIDILIVVNSVEGLNNVSNILQQNGYLIMSESDIRISLNKGYTENGFAEKVFHLHIRLNGDTDEICFRDYLNSHADTAKEYERLKLRLWKEYEHNRAAYTDAKTDFVKKHTKLAKSERSDIVFTKINRENFGVNFLDNFILNQTVKHCWRKVNGSYKLVPVSYTEDWNLTERRSLAERILTCADNGSVALAALSSHEVIGFALLTNKLFGSKNQYIDLAEFYVSKPFRRNGIGKMLFCYACVEARRLGAEKLYISAHSAEESISAYKKYGCIFAEEPDAAHIEKEPCDLQLEYCLKPRIYEVENKEKYMPLLLLADEQMKMVERYIYKCKMYVLDDCGVKGEIAVMDAGGGVLEIKNLAILPEFQRCGYGKSLIEFICGKYKNEYSVLQVGTGKSPLTLPFYEKCGFRVSHTVKNFFTDNYDHDIIEAGVLLKDMVYLRKKL